MVSSVHDIAPKSADNRGSGHCHMVKALYENLNLSGSTTATMCMNTLTDC